MDAHAALFWALCAGLGLLALAALGSTTPGGPALLVLRNRWAGYGGGAVGTLALSIAAAFALLAAAGCEGHWGQRATCTSIPASAGPTVADIDLTAVFALSVVGWPCLACYAVAEAVPRLRSGRRL